MKNINRLYFAKQKLLGTDKLEKLAFTSKEARDEYTAIHRYSIAVPGSISTVDYAHYQTSVNDNYDFQIFDTAKQAAESLMVRM